MKSIPETYRALINLNLDMIEDTGTHAFVFDTEVVAEVLYELFYDETYDMDLVMEHADAVCALHRAMDRF